MEDCADFTMRVEYDSGGLYTERVNRPQSQIDDIKINVASAFGEFIYMQA